MDKKFLVLKKEELSKNSKIKFNLYENKEEIYNKFALEVINIIKEKNQKNQKTKLILPVGPRLQYPKIVDICNKENISWKNVYVFMMDEYLDWQGRYISEESPLSFRNYLKGVLKNLKDELKLPEENLFCPDPLNIDFYSKKIQELGGIDACFGGIGSHGHVAFNEGPNRSFLKISKEEFLNSKTRIVTLHPETIILNSIRANWGNYADFPNLAITVGMKDIFNAKKIRLYCDGGEWQRFVLRTALFGDEDINYPVTLLQQHPDIEINADSITAQEFE